MAIPILEAFDGADIALTSLVFSGVAPGAASPSQTVKVFNNRAGASAVDPARNVWLRVLARRQGQSDWQSAGMEVLDQHLVEVRVVAGDGVAVSATGWRGLGAAAALALPDLPDGAGVVLEVRVTWPAGGGSDAIELSLRFTRTRRSWIGRAHRDGISLAPTEPALAVQEGAIAPTSPASDVLDLPAVAYFDGDVHRELGAVQLQLDDQDGAGEALAALEGYWVGLTLGAGGLTVTKGLRATLPLTAAERPELPDELVWAWIQRPEDGTIEAADIFVIAPVAFFSAAASGLDLTIGPGEAQVNGYEIRTTTPDVAPLPASSTAHVWLLDDVSFAVTTDRSRPGERALLQWTAVTDGAGVTRLEDRRSYLTPGPSGF